MVTRSCWRTSVPGRRCGTSSATLGSRCSVEGTEIEPPGLQQYLVVHGTARITEGGGPQLLQELAHVYLGPDVKFPAFDNPPPGRIMHISVERIAGVGPWVHAD